MPSNAVNKSLIGGGVVCAAIGGYAWWRGRQIRVGQTMLSIGTISVTVGCRYLQIQKPQTSSPTDSKKRSQTDPELAPKKSVESDHNSNKTSSTHQPPKEEDLQPSPSHAGPIRKDISSQGSPEQKEDSKPAIGQLFGTGLTREDIPLQSSPEKTENLKSLIDQSSTTDEAPSPGGNDNNNNNPYMLPLAPPANSHRTPPLKSHFSKTDPEPAPKKSVESDHNSSKTPSTHQSPKEEDLQPSPSHAGPIRKGISSRGSPEQKEDSKPTTGQSSGTLEPSSQEENDNNNNNLYALPLAPPANSHLTPPLKSHRSTIDPQTLSSMKDSLEGESLSSENSNPLFYHLTEPVDNAEATILYRFGDAIGEGIDTTAYTAARVVKTGNEIKQLDDAVWTEVETSKIKAKNLARIRHGYALQLSLEDHPNVYKYWEMKTQDTKIMGWGPRFCCRLDEVKVLSPKDMTSIVCDIAKGLAFLHKNSIVHRDVKPANIGLERDEDGNPLAVVFDSGFWRELPGNQAIFSKGTDDWFGSLGHMAPERFCREAYGPKSDVYSLGITAYQLLGLASGKSEEWTEKYPQFVDHTFTNPRYRDFTGFTGSFKDKQKVGKEIGDALAKSYKPVKLPNFNKTKRVLAEVVNEALATIPRSDLTDSTTMCSKRPSASDIAERLAQPHA